MRVAMILLTLILIIPCMKGQELKLVVKNFQNSKQIMEEYYVFAKDEKMKQGEYIQYFRTTNEDFLKQKADYICKKGYYFQNKLDSIWTYFGSYSTDHKLIKEENYRKGKKIGIWKTYIESGSVIKQFDYNLI